MRGKELSPPSGSTSSNDPEMTRTLCAMASAAVAVNSDQARRLAVDALTT
jgi:hypothetical protein